MQGVGEEEGWETVRNTKHEEQTEMLDSWKDELNNLLVFVRHWFSYSRVSN